jgi:hypothetical protein
MNALIKEAVHTSETSVYFNETKGAISQKTDIFVLWILVIVIKYGILYCITSFDSL